MNQPSPAELLKRAMQPKSDQLNADDLVSGPRIITVTSVDVAASGEQRVSIHYENENGRPYKPCKTMMKLISFGWGEDPLVWVGRSMRLYFDPEVMWAGEKVGGIRISEMDNIPKAFSLSLMKSKGKKTAYTVNPLKHGQQQNRQQPVSQTAQQPTQANTVQTQEEIDNYVASQKVQLENAAKISMQEFSRVWTDSKYKPLLSDHKDSLKAKYFAEPAPTPTGVSDPNDLLAELNAEARNGVENF